MAGREPPAARPLTVFSHHSFPFGESYLIKDEISNNLAEYIIHSILSMVVCYICIHCIIFEEMEWWEIILLVFIGVLTIYSAIIDK